MTATVNETTSAAPAEPTQGGRRASEVGSAGAAHAPATTPDPEAVPRAKRRRFSAKYKLKILEQADRCATGELGALLRREGLYSSHLTDWRRQRAQGALKGLASRPRGPQPKVQAPEQARLVELERENAQLRNRLSQAETIIEVQKKVSSLLGISLNPTHSSVST